jgi:hypothetical protein
MNMISDYERGRRSLSPAMAARFSAVLHIDEGESPRDRYNGTVMDEQTDFVAEHLTRR